VFSAGGQKLFWSTMDWIDSYHITFGRSIYDRFGEVMIAIGVNRNQRQYNTESERGIIYSDFYYGLHIKAQALLHFPQVLGLGLTFNANLNKDVSYYVITLNMNLGFWNLP